MSFASDQIQQTQPLRVCAIEVIIIAYNLKKLPPICVLSRCGAPLSLTSMTASTVLLIPLFLYSFRNRASRFGTDGSISGCAVFCPNVNDRNNGRERDG